MTGDASIRIARAYDEAGDSDSVHILIDRIWPRGVSKENLKHDNWIKEIAPSSRLREWFGHDPAKWEEFRRRYRAELDDSPATVEQLLDWCRKGRVTLPYGARDREHNQALVLRAYLAEWLSSERGAP